MSFDLGNFIAAPSQELLDSAKKSDLLDIVDHYGLPNVKKTMLKHEIKKFSSSSLWTRKFLIPRQQFRF